MLNNYTEPDSTREKASRGRVLIVDDDENIRYLFHAKLEQAGFEVHEAEAAHQLSELLENHSYTAVLLDNYLGDSLGVECIPGILKISPTTRIVMLTGHGSVELAVEALKEGASGFLLKTDPPDSNIEKFIQILASELVDETYDGSFTTTGMVGTSDPMKKIFSQLAKVSPTEITVLIGGESGTGKELVARAIHDLSPRRNSGPFIAINCGAISENLLEAELFGSKKGSYTGSNRDRKGYFETCHNGTLFLDEIGEMPPSLQVKLLRVLQEREITPVGSCHPIKVNTRVIAATNCNLLRDMKSGRFREDLFYRLSVMKVDLPPLRDRLEDIPLLVNHFVEKSNARFGKSVRLPSYDILAKLKAYHWPGNIRELHNAVERAVLLSETGEMRVEDLLPVRVENGSRDAVNTSSKLKLPLEFNEAKETFEKSYIEQLLSATSGNITEAAKVSGQYRPAIYRLLKKYSLDANLYK